MNIQKTTQSGTLNLLLSRLISLLFQCSVYIWFTFTTCRTQLALPHPDIMFVLVTHAYNAIVNCHSIASAACIRLDANPCGSATDCLPGTPEPPASHHKNGVAVLRHTPVHCKYMFANNASSLRFR